MYLLEHDAKTLLAASGVPVPPGVLVEEEINISSLPPGPWVVKAQVAVGGRGKAGGIRKAGNSEELRDALDDMSRMQISGRRVRACRVESAVDQAHEAYISFMLDASAASVRVLISAQGGVDIETLAETPGSLRTALSDPDEQSILRHLESIVRDFELPVRDVLMAAGTRLAKAFCGYECVLLEVNPLFVMPDGSWLAGDAKMITDDNALPRQQEIAAMLEGRAHAYAEAHLKLHHGCDYVVVDPDGEIGLLTTGAGLSMMLIDELRASGLRPYNFLDVRTGGLRGDPARLVNVLSWIAQGPRVKVALVNIFAGITDLGEFARLLLAAFRSVPQLKVPVVARLVGNGVESARTILGEAGIPAVTELDVALQRVRLHLDEASN
jgi:succinyl-CoA synthetase beta subunit